MGAAYRWGWYIGGGGTSVGGDKAKTLLFNTEKQTLRNRLRYVCNEYCCVKRVI